MLKEEKLSEVYVKDFLKRSQMYPCADEKQRRKSIMVGMPVLKSAYKQGYRKGIVEALEWVKNNLTTFVDIKTDIDYGTEEKIQYVTTNDCDTVEEFIEMMKKELT